MNNLDLSRSACDAFWQRFHPNQSVRAIGDDNNGYVPDFLGEIYIEDVQYDTRWGVSLVLGE